MIIMPRTNTNKSQAISVYGTEVKTSYLRSVVAKKIMDGDTKDQIVNWLMDEYQMPFKNAVSAVRLGYVYIFLYSELTKDEIRQLSMARLEELYQMAEKDGMLKGKDFYNVQMKNIDLVNKTALLYAPDNNSEDNNGDINFNLNIGTTSSTHYTEEKDETEDDE